MAEESTQESQEVQETEAAQPKPEETDWKAEAQKWEKRARENKAAAAELAQLKEEQESSMTEAEKLQKRATEAEAKVVELEAANAHAAGVANVTKETGVPVEFLEFCDTEESMKAFAKLWKAYHEEHEPEPPHAWAKAPSKRLVSSGSTNLSNRDIFASLFDQN